MGKKRWKTSGKVTKSKYHENSNKLMIVKMEYKKAGVVINGFVGLNTKM